MKRLKSINVIVESQISCMLCGLDDEDIDHLFVPNNYVPMVWSKAIYVDRRNFVGESEGSKGFL
ncbi:uncharacterized protein DS421_16g541480 [Arachis hypogaea]|nr:uncharacterized protein DS421_16g541480 [Arachis hypogaea]